MTARQEVMRRLCKLTSRVAEDAIWPHDNCTTASDCFCGEGGYWDTASMKRDPDAYYRHDMVTIEYIERAVQHALDSRMRLEDLPPLPVP